MKRLILAVFAVAFLLIGFSSTSEAALKTGWVKTNGHWYYYKSGSLYKGWLKSGNSWYYLDNSGVMKTGWAKVGNNWYFLEPSGEMKTGWILSGGKWYFLNPNGVMRTGWLNQGNVWYYLDTSGAMKTGWQTIQNKIYFFYKSGTMAANTVIDGYQLGSDGARLDKGIITKKIYKKGKQLDVEINYPELSLLQNTALQTNINQKIENEATKIYQDTVDTAQNMAGDPFEANLTAEGKLDYRVTTNKNNVLSILLKAYLYEGGAHGMSYYIPYNIDTKNGKILTLSDLFAPGTDYISEISEQVKQQMDARGLTKDLFDPFTTIQDENDFYLTDNALVYYFQEYEYLPYSDGMPEFIIPFKNLKGFQLPH
jgi:hypothetical protein